MSIQLKRIYETPSRTDGSRVLVDGLWPRGVAKADAALDDWCKAVSPSAELRRWFSHDRERWDEFSQRYGAELYRADVSGGELDRLRDIAAVGDLTLLYAAKDTACNHAVVLKAYLENTQARRNR